MYPCRYLSLFIILLSLWIPSTVYAHNVNPSDYFYYGFIHPILGFDHLLAMLAVGILSTQIGGKAIWTVPLTFVVVMLIGGTLGIVGVPFLSVELGIAVSVLALGVAIMADKKISPMIAMLFVALFAIFHGHAHGTEMPYFAEPLLYALGFDVGTTVIHVAGILVGVFAKQLKKGDRLLQLLGAGIAAIGIYLIVM